MKTLFQAIVVAAMPLFFLIIGILTGVLTKLELEIILYAAMVILLVVLSGYGFFTLLGASWDKSKNGVVCLFASLFISVAAVHVPNGTVLPFITYMLFLTGVGLGHFVPFPQAKK